MAKWRVGCSHHKFFFPRFSGFNSPLMRNSSPIGRSAKVTSEAMPTSTAGAMMTAKMVPIATSTEYDCVARQLQNKWSVTAFVKRLSMDALSDSLRAVRLTDRAPSDVSPSDCHYRRMYIF